MPSTPSKPSSRVRRPGVVIAAVAMAAVLLGIASFTALKPHDKSEERRATAAAAEKESAAAENRLMALARRDPGDRLAMGRADAPVVMIEYADFQCGYCGKFARDTEPELIEKYVDEGVLRIEWRNLPIFGEESENAARGAWAAGQQGRFWQFHTAAYAEGAKEKGFSEDRVKELAKEAGVPDLRRFAADARSAAARAAVKRDQDEGYGIGVSSTPSFLINSTPIAGAQPLTAFTDAIETARRADANKPLAEDTEGSAQ
ncbi:DsbA family protein [Streptomyces sp. CAU 1734]|uniref:DsbA family protein n=1 Tax=Streptomyces sp. CAU 1734 TaxID=3140360 RepID=UPI0032617416